MDPKVARQLLDVVCAELDPARDEETQRALQGMVGRYLRPIGLGLLLAAAPFGCDTADAYGMPTRDQLPPVGDAYGVPGDWRPPVGDAYGIPADWRPADLRPTEVKLPPPGDLYGVIDKKLPPVGDAYGVPDTKLPPVGDAYGIPKG